MRTNLTMKLSVTENYFYLLETVGYLSIVDLDDIILYLFLLFSNNQVNPVHFGVS